MHPHRQVSIYVDAEIADGLHWIDVDAVNQHSSAWKLMLAPACPAPQNLGVKVQYNTATTLSKTTVIF